MRKQAMTTRVTRGPSELSRDSHPALQGQEKLRPKAKKGRKCVPGRGNNMEKEWRAKKTWYFPRTNSVWVKWRVGAGRVEWSSELGRGHILKGFVNSVKEFGSTKLISEFEFN